MHIGFDNRFRLQRNVYYFEYNQIRYKLIQNNPRKHCDVLLTLIDYIKNEHSQDKAYRVAAEFLSALSWANNSDITLFNIGGWGKPKGFTLRTAKCQSFSFPKIPFRGNMIGADISSIPKIETEKHKIALALYREASASNNDYLAFIFYWQILEVSGAAPINWMNKVYRKKDKHRLFISNSDIRYMQIGSKKIGDYLYDDCRNAIAHITRKPNKRTLDLNNPNEKARLAVSTRVIKQFAQLYIKNILDMNKKLHLIRKRKGSGFPFYADEDYMKNNPCVMAYSYRSTPLFKAKKRK